MQTCQFAVIRWADQAGTDTCTDAQQRNMDDVLAK
jgi:hypothetical protein